MKSILVTDIESRQTFILEIWRRGSRKLHSNVMRAVCTGQPLLDRDTPIELRRVPLYIRRAAKAALFV